MSNDKITSLKDLAKTGIPDPKPLIKDLSEMNEDGVIKKISNEEMDSKVNRAFSDNGRILSKAEVGNLLGREMMENRWEKLSDTRGGIQPFFDDIEAAALQKSAKEAAIDLYESNTDLMADAIKILISNGYTTDQIDNMPYYHMMDTARKLMKDKDSDLVSSAVGKLELQPIDLSKPIGTTGLEKNSAVDSINLIEGSNKPVKEENKEDYEEDFKEVPMKEVIQPKKVYVKFTDKPRSGYSLRKTTMEKKLLERQKRGRSTLVFLPNSNLTLEIFEMKQPTIMKEVVTDIWLSRQMEHRRKTIKMILERSNICCSDGDEIDTDGLMHFISVDDVPYIYLGACMSNAVDKVPMGVICERCGSQLEITVDIQEAFSKMAKEIPVEISSKFVRDDTFEAQVRNSQVNKTALVVDEDARAIIELRNPSIETHLRVVEYTKSYIIEKYQTLIPEKAVGKSVDIVYQALLATGNTDISNDVSISMLLAYIEAIRYYSFDAPSDNWQVDSYIDEQVTSGENGIDSTLLAISQLENTTTNLIAETIKNEFVEARYSVTTGPWMCIKCKGTNDTTVEGLGLLMNTLQTRIQSNK